MSTSLSLTQPQLPIQPNNWTDEKIKLLIKWRQQSRVYHWLHAKSSSYKDWWYVRIFYMSAFLTILGLGQNFSMFLTEGTDAFLFLQITNAILLVIIGISNIYLKTSKIAELVEKHSNTAKSFYALQTEIEEQLSQTPEDRDDGKIYMKKIRVKLTSLTQNSPGITQSVWKKFSSAIKNEEIFNESDPSAIYTSALSKMKSKLVSPSEFAIDISPAVHIAKPTISPAISPVILSPNVGTSDNDLEKDHNLKKEQRDFDNRLSKSGNIDPKMIKALEYQMARFN